MANTNKLLTIRPQRPRTTPLSALAARHEASFVAGANMGAALVSGVTIDSRDVQPGDLYVGLPGAKHHGAKFAAAARACGAVGMLTDGPGAQVAAAVGDDDFAILRVDRPIREILGALAADIYGTADLQAKTFGVTGTNGKTSVVYCLAALLEALGLNVGLSSTAERRIGSETLVSALTSPEASELHGLLARMVEREVAAVLLEVSAQAVGRHRIDGLLLDVVAFNNLSQDHLEEFGDMRNYFAQKVALFTPARARRGVVVVDQPWGQELARRSTIPVTRLATEYGQEAEWHLAVTRQDLDGVSFVLQGPQGERFVGRVPVFGRFMAENAALALIMLVEAGFHLDEIAASLQRGLIPLNIPGRLEEITATDSAHSRAAAAAKAAPPVRCFVDYGHTPGAFAAMLDALAEVAPRKIIFMFGADGDRDTTKREMMGRIAGQGADTVIICDYHPRSEPPEQIRAQLLAGARAAQHAAVYEEADPRRAIRLAIALAEPGDVIVYAGPGHEDYQEIAGEFLPYSARDETRMAMREAGLFA